jgi:hypothetical protein
MEVETRHLRMRSRGFALRTPTYNRCPSPLSAQLPYTRVAALSRRPEAAGLRTGGIIGIDAASRVLLLATIAVEHGLIFMLEPTSAVRDWTLDSLRRGERVPTCAADLPEPPNDL